MADGDNSPQSPTRSDLKRKLTDAEHDKETLSRRVQEQQHDLEQSEGENRRLRLCLQQQQTSIQTALSAPRLQMASKYQLQMVKGPQLCVTGLSHSEVVEVAAGAQQVVVYRAVAHGRDSLFIPRDVLVLLGVMAEHAIPSKRPGSGTLAKMVDNHGSKVEGALQDAKVFDDIVASGAEQVSESSSIGIKKRGFAGKRETSRFLPLPGIVSLCCKLLEKFEGYDAPTWWPEGEEQPVMEEVEEPAATDAADEMDAEEAAKLARKAAAAQALEHSHAKAAALHSCVTKQLAWLALEDAEQISGCDWVQPMYCS